MNAMNPLTVAPRIPTHPAMTKALLASDGLKCSIMILAPWEEMRCSSEWPAVEHLLFVLEGAVNVRSEGLTSILNAEEAIHLGAGHDFAMSNISAGSSKLLRVDFALREVVTTPLVTFDDPRARLEKALVP